MSNIRVPDALRNSLFRNLDPPLIVILVNFLVMERETELTQSWNSEITRVDENGGVLQGIPLLVGGEMRTFSLPAPLDDDGTDVSLKDWQVGPGGNSTDRERRGVYPIKPFKGSVRMRFTPMEPRLDEDQYSSQGQSSPELFETPTTPRTPRASSTGTRSNSASPTKSFRHQGNPPGINFQSLQPETPSGESDFSPNRDAHHQQQNITSIDVSETSSPRTSGMAFDACIDGISPDEVTPENANLRCRSQRGSSRGNSLRVSFVEKTEVAPEPRPSPPIKIRHTLKSRSLREPKEVKISQPKWESSTKISSHPTPSPTPKPTVHAPKHGVRPRKSSTPGAKPRAHSQPTPEIVPEPHSNLYSSAGRSFGSQRHSRRSPDSQHFSGESDKLYDSSSQELGTSSNESGRENVTSLKPNSPSYRVRSNRKQQNGRQQVDDPDEVSQHISITSMDTMASRPELLRLLFSRSIAFGRKLIWSDWVQDTKGVMCGGGFGDTKLSAEFVRLLSKLCRVSIPSPKQPDCLKPALQQRGRSLEKSNSMPVKWDQAKDVSPMRENYAVIGRRDSLRLLSERCSTAPAPTYSVDKPRKIRTHGPHIHFYKSISKNLDLKLRSATLSFHTWVHTSSCDLTHHAVAHQSLHSSWIVFNLQHSHSENSSPCSTILTGFSR